MYKKKPHVFWVQTNTGLVLQNVNTNKFIELNKIQGKVWEYSDGTFTLENIIEILSLKYDDIPRKEISKIVRSAIEIFLNFDLISD